MMSMHWPPTVDQRTLAAAMAEALDNFEEEPWRGPTLALRAFGCVDALGFDDEEDPGTDLRFDDWDDEDEEED